MWQMEPQTFVAITCHATLSAELQLRPIFSLIRVCLAGSVLLYQCDQPFLPLQHLLFSYLCSGGLEWGACRLQAYLFTLRASSIVPTSLPPNFLWRISHIFVLVVVLGTGHGLGTWEPPVAFLNLCLVWLSRNSFLQHISSLSNTPEIFLQQWTIQHDYHRFVLFHWAETW